MSKPKKRGSVSHVAKAAGPSYKFKAMGVIYIDEKDGERNLEVKKIIEIKLPCTLAELVFEISNAVFSSVEELAFKAGITFLPAKEIPIGEDKQKTEEIPF